MFRGINLWNENQDSQLDSLLFIKRKQLSKLINPFCPRSVDFNYSYPRQIRKFVWQTWPLKAWFLHHSIHKYKDEFLLVKWSCLVLELGVFCDACSPAGMKAAAGSSSPVACGSQSLATWLFAAKDGLQPSASNTAFTSLVGFGLPFWTVRNSFWKAAEK